MSERTRIRLALLGVTGAGKSALGNTILRKKPKPFESRCASDSVTVKCDSDIANIAGTEIMVVDTPGFQDTSRCIEEIKSEVAESVRILSPGPHAFLIVLNPSRFFETDRRCLDDIEKLFGNANFYKHAVVVFTRKNEIYADKDWENINDFVTNRVCQEVQNVISKCCKRVIAVENLGPDSSLDAESNVVLESVKGLISDNGGSYYDHEYFRLLGTMGPSEANAQNVKKKMEAVAAKNGNSFCTIL